MIDNTAYLYIDPANKLRLAWSTFTIQKKFYYSLSL